MISLPDTFYQESRLFFQQYFDGDIDEELDIIPFEWKIVQQGLDYPETLTPEQWERIHKLQRRFSLNHKRHALFYQLGLKELLVTGTFTKSYESLKLFFMQQTPQFYIKDLYSLPYKTLCLYGDIIVPYWSHQLRQGVGSHALEETLRTKEETLHPHETLLLQIMHHDQAFCDTVAQRLLHFFDKNSWYNQPLLRIAKACEHIKPSLTMDEKWNRLYAQYTRPALMELWKCPTPMSTTPFHDYLQESHPREPLSAWMHYCHMFSMCRGRHPDILHNTRIRNPENRQHLYQKTYQQWHAYMQNYLQSCTGREKDLLLFAVGYNLGNRMAQKIKRTWYRHMGLLDNGITLTQRYEQLYQEWDVDTLIQSFQALHDRAPEPHELFEYLEINVLQTPIIETELHL